MHKVFFCLIHSPLLFIAHSHTYCTIFIIIKSGQRPINTHIHMNVYVYTSYIRNKYMNFWTGQFVSFHQQTLHTCSCMYVCLCLCVWLYVIQSVRVIRNQKWLLSICKYNMLKIKQVFKKQFSTMGCCCCRFRWVFSCCFRAIFAAIHMLYDLVLAGLITCTYLSMNEFLQHY